MSTHSSKPNSRGPLPILSFPDPNEQQNRAPSSAEMIKLKQMFESSAKVTSLLDQESDQLHDSYEAVHNQYLKLVLETEAAQSELYRIRNMINANKVQRTLHESEQQDLLALMHPIRRCPDDILLEILELISRQTTAGESKQRQSFYLSCVCQNWRAVAISMPLLWETVSFHLDRSPKDLRHQQQTLVSHIRGRAVKIQVHALTHDSGERLNACGLDMFPLIGNLEFNLANSEKTGSFLRSASPLPAGRVRHMTIMTWTGFMALSPLEQPLDLGSYLLELFPGLTSASILFMPTVSFQLTNANSTLTALDIDTIEQVSIMTVLRYCPKLVTLRIRDTTIQGFSTPVVAPSLRNLELTRTLGDRWMAHTSLPKLDTLVFRTNRTPTSLAFISSNRSLKKLLYNGSLDEIVNIAPQIDRAACSATFAGSLRLHTHVASCLSIP
ncbi:hypothetical protein M408DRAFT_264188 [Serendipita vermifera MAFF 305830]|uniref:Uncharacterized protein n=1 Tax=Serendipita vermifera MAFF 305830 TaxID=933852 RepID=A0A0C3ATE8_SERVB|nr:hypothetical protein M408DRAFT_264188 [Serendipita vermifera MAFF 305830]